MEKTVTAAIGMTANYASNSDVQKIVISHSITSLLNAIQEMHTEHPENFVSSDPFCIADLGCADGLNSIPILQAIIERVRSFNSVKPILVILNDLPTTNIEIAITNVSQALQSLPNVKYQPIGKSFYLSLVPESTIDLCYSFSSVHYLIQLPPYTHKGFCLYMHDAIREAKEIKAFKKIADEDWTNFVLHRAKELKPSARLIVGTYTIPDPLTKTSELILNYFQWIKEAQVAALVKQGLAKYEHAIMFPMIFRQEKDFAVPFVEGHVPSLVLVQYLVTNLVEPCWARYCTHGNIDRYVQEYIGFIRAYSPRYSTLHHS